MQKRICPKLLYMFHQSIVSTLCSFFNAIVCWGRRGSVRKRDILRLDQLIRNIRKVCGEDGVAEDTRQTPELGLLPPEKLRELQTPLTEMHH